MKAEQHEAIIYTLDGGAEPAYSVHLKCEGTCIDDAIAV